MKKINHLQAITVSFFTMIIIVSWSCSASRKQAVSCPEFPENRYKTVEHNSRTKRHETTFTYRQNRNQSKKKGSSIYSVKIKQGIQLPDSKETSDRLVYLTNDVLQSKQPDRIEYTDQLVLSDIEFIHPANDISGYHKTKYRKERKRNTSAVIMQVAGCDTVILRKGNSIVVRVLEVGRDQIKYKKCNNPDGPLYSMGISEIYMIKYNNGTRDFFDQSSSDSYGEKAPPVRSEGMSIASFVCGIGGLIIFGIPLGILALVFGGIGLNKIRQFPDRFSGKGFAIAGIILGLIDIIGVLLILASM